MKRTLFVFLFFAIIPNLLFAQFTQQGPKLVGTGGVGQSHQGSVAISSDGNTAIEGGYYDNTGIGAIWVFTRSGGVWSQQGPKLVGTGGVGQSHQGSVAISSDGNTAIVGGQNDNSVVGAVWVFTRSGGVWTQQGPKLVGTGGVGQSNQGVSVAISSDGNTAIEGGYEDNSVVGAVWIFTRSGGVWSQQGPKLVGTGAVGNFVYQGVSVAISSDGNTAIEGGQGDNNYTGAVWVFIRSGGVWSQQGSKLVGTGAGNSVYQGGSVAISSDGNTAIEGGDEDNSNAGAVWIFTRSGGVWTQQGSKLVGTGAVGNAGQGWSVAISPDGNSFVEGGMGDNGDVGAVWVFTRSGGVWTQLGTKLIGSGAAGHSLQGISVAISSEGTVIEGGPYDNSLTGAVWVFVYPEIGITPISSEVPKSFQLMQNYPNPFNPSTKVKFDIPASGLQTVNVQLKIYDITGREAATLVNQQLQPGSYEVEWNAANYTSGVYFYKLVTSGFEQTKKLVLIK
jgi:hypothetical protein